VANETSRIASTPLLGLIPLGSPGDRNYGRLVDIVSTRFGARHAALFAEPEPAGDGSALDWYVPGLERAARLSQLPPGEAAAVQRTLDTLASDIRGYADQVDSRPRSPANRAVVETLRNALSVPGQDHVYAVNGEPVLVAWAYRFERVPPLEVGLVRPVDPPAARTPRPAAAPPAAAAAGAAEDTRDPTHQVAAPASGVAGPAGEPAGGRPDAGAEAVPPVAAIRRPFQYWLLWPLWLLFAALFASTLWVLLRACAINMPLGAWPSITWCGGAPDEALQVAELQGLVDNLEEQAARRARECPAGQQLEVVRPLPPPPPPPPARRQPAPQPAAPPTQAQVEERKQEHAAQSGALEISLAWNGPADLDLYVKCPTGEIIYYGKPEACGGKLQIDMNAGGNDSNEPIEHVIFPSASSLPAGTLEIGVNWFNEKGESRASIPATILVKRGGETIERRVDVPRPSDWGKNNPVFYWQLPAR
jgi:hypothetical protein